MCFSPRRFFDTHLTSPALEADMLVGNFGLSRASLYRLFSPIGGVAAYIRRERLRRIALAAELRALSDLYNRNLQLITQKADYILSARSSVVVYKGNLG
jgi:AraC-like DNA-binding protein